MIFNQIPKPLSYLELDCYNNSFKLEAALLADKSLKVNILDNSFVLNIRTLSYIDFYNVDLPKSFVDKIWKFSNVLW